MKWLVVHKEESYITNSRALGFEENIHHVNEITIGDEIIYYQNGGKVKGSFIVVDIIKSPQKFESTWNSPIQFKIEPCIELIDYINIKNYVEELSIFTNKRSWGPSIMGVNAIRQLNTSDYTILRNAIDIQYIKEKKSLTALEDEIFQQEVDKALKVSKEDLLTKIKSKSGLPEEIVNLTKSYKRNPDVVAYALLSANGICDNCNNNAPFIRKSNDEPYLEVHHIISLLEGGTDTIDNVVALCPNCHRMTHYGK